MFYLVISRTEYDKMVSKGYYTITEDEVEESIGKSIEWLQSQMSANIDGYNDEMPILMWSDIDDISISDVWCGNNVILSVDKDESEVLIGSYQALHEVNDDEFVLGDKIECENKEDSWGYSFDLRTLSELDHDKYLSKVVGVTNKIKLNEVASIKVVFNFKGDQTQMYNNYSDDFKNEINKITEDITNEFLAISKASIKETIEKTIETEEEFKQNIERLLIDNNIATKKELDKLKSKHK